VKIVLGTAQFGLDYGISNKQGKTHRKNIPDILNYAHKNRINFLDTALSYGNSEEVIGSIRSTQAWNIVTKTKNFKNKLINNDDANELRRSFEQSLVKLNRDRVYGLLMHDCNDLFKPGGEKLFKEMKCIRSLGKAKKIGASVYNIDQIYQLLDSYDIDIIQLPINIFDQRLIKFNVLEKIKELNIEIHARSVFLQGLLLLPLDDVPSYFSQIKNQLENFTIRAKELSLSKLELALAFVQSINEIDKIVIGINSLGQLYEIINSTNVRLNIFDFESFSVENQKIIDPSQWKLI